jgi:hypothetical protein
MTLCAAAEERASLEARFDAAIDRADQLAWLKEMAGR